jgi:hypothetical protein
LVSVNATRVGERLVIAGEAKPGTESPLPTNAHVCGRLAEETASLPHGVRVPTPTLPPPIASVVVPVVVAPPEMVRPPVCVPSPMVEEASEKKPLEKLAKVVEE